MSLGPRLHFSHTFHRRAFPTITGIAANDCRECLILLVGKSEDGRVTRPVQLTVCACHPGLPDALQRCGPVLLGRGARRVAQHGARLRLADHFADQVEPQTRIAELRTSSLPRLAAAAPKLLAVAGAAIDS